MQWFRAWQERRFLAACVRRRVVPMPLLRCQVMVDWCRDVEAFCQRSGFLRDGRYPGGRHAERTIRGISAVLPPLIEATVPDGLTLH